MEVQTRGGLVQNVQGAARVALGQFLRELDALGLTAGQRGGTLAQADVAQANIQQGLQAAADLRHGFEEGMGLFHRHVQHVGNALALVVDLQRLAVVALALAHVAGDVHIGQEVHFHADHAVAFTGLAAAAAHVEGEAPRAVAALAGGRYAGKQFADGREEPGVGGGVAARGATDGALVDGDHLVEVVQTVDLAAGGRFGLGAVELLRQRLVQGVVDEGGLAAARNTGDADHQAHGDVDARFLQVVAAGIQDADPAPVRRLALGGHGNLQGAAQVPAGEGFGLVDDVLHAALGDDLAAVLAGTQAHVDHVVGGADGVFVMLDDQHRVAQVAQVGEGGEQPVVVALVKADGGLVQHVHHAGQPGADL